MQGQIEHKKSLETQKNGSYENFQIYIRRDSAHARSN